MRRAVVHGARDWLALGVALGLLVGCDRLSKHTEDAAARDSAAQEPPAAATPTPDHQQKTSLASARSAAPARLANAPAVTQTVADTEGRSALAQGAPAGAVGGAAPPAEFNGKACPSGMALIQGRFCMDRWEASLQTQAGEAHSPYKSVGAMQLKAVTASGQVPQAYISMNEAAAACARSNKRLCSTAEFLDACAGSSKRPLRAYPYGNKEEPNACNVDQPGSPTMVLHAGRRKRDSYWMNDPRINQLGGTVAPSGAFDQCVSPDGVYDLVGNLLEWTQSDRPLLMGGYYLDSHENGDGCSYVTMRHGADYHDYSTGFRCCSAPVEDDSSQEQLAAGAEPASEPSAATEPAPEPASEPVAAAEPSQEPAAPPAAPPAAGPPGSQGGADELRASLDPPGFRSFENPGARLPQLGPRATYASSTDPCPTDMALVEGERCSLPIQTCKYWVDDPGMPNRSCGEFEPTVCKGAKTPMRYCIDRYEYTPPSYTHPIINVSWGEAQMMCGKLGKRLCYEPEWEFACEGPEALPYPYGYKRDGAACNHDRDDLFTSRGKLNDQRVPGDSLPECKSPFGVFNIVGNVDEWTSRGGGGGQRRSVLRGGWWLKGRNRCRAATGSHGENYAGAQTGFRCCMAAR